MRNFNAVRRVALVAVLFLVTSAGSCNDLAAPEARPVKSVDGSWGGELFGVRLQLGITESGTPDGFLNLTVLAGTGRLVYGSAPDEFVAVIVRGSNSPSGPYFDLAQPGIPDKVYGRYGASLQSDGTLLGMLERFPGVEPMPSPWTATWPTGTASAPLRLTRQ